MESLNVLLKIEMIIIKTYEGFSLQLIINIRGINILLFLRSADRIDRSRSQYRYMRPKNPIIIYPDDVNKDEYLLCISISRCK